MIQKPKEDNKVRYIGKVDFVRGDFRVKPGQIGTVVSKVVTKGDNEKLCWIEFNGIRVQFEREDYDKLELVKIKKIKLVEKGQHPKISASYCVFAVSGGENYKVTATDQTLKGFHINLETACRIALECHLERERVKGNEFDVRDYYLEVRQRLRDVLERITFQKSNSLEGFEIILKTGKVVFTEDENTFLVPKSTLEKLTSKNIPFRKLELET